MSNLWRWAMLALLLGAVIFLAASCKVVQTTQSHTQTDTLYITKTDYRLDSIYIDRWHTIETKGDTIYRLDSVVRYAWRYKTLTDTLIESRTDSIYVDRVQEVRKRSGYDRFVSVGFWLLLASVLGVAAWRIYRFFA